VHDAEKADFPPGEVPHGVGPEVFRERLRQVAGQDPEHGAQVTLQDATIFVADIESIEEEAPGSERSRVRLRNGVIIAGVTGAAIVAALATVRFRRRRER
jgi:hypothetical protein